MKRWMLVWGGLILSPLLWAQDAPTVEVAPSPVVKYPNPDDVLNKTAPQSPAPAAPKAPAAAPTSTASPPASPPADAPPASDQTVAKLASPAPSAPSSGWLWRWIVQGTESEARTWAAQVSDHATLRSLGDLRWEVTVPWEAFDPTTSELPSVRNASLLHP